MQKNSQRKGEQIILRDGTILDAKVQQITQNSVKFNNLTAGIKLDEVPLKDVYMVKSGKRGNLFFTQGGRRKTGEVNDIDPKATIIYTTDYRELPVFTLEYDMDKIIYTTSLPDRQNPQPLRKTLPQSLVFLIVYPDGTSDILFDMNQEQPYQTASELQSAKAEQQDELKVVFHTVKQGETLAALAERYDVAIADIREWNELKPTVKDTAPLKPGQQLMLYVKSTN